MQVKDVIEPVLTYCKAERLNRPETQTKYEDCLKCWIIALLGERELEGLGRLDVLTLRDAMVSKQLSVAGRQRQQYWMLGYLKQRQAAGGRVGVWELHDAGLIVATHSLTDRWIDSSGGAVHRRFAVTGGIEGG